MSNTADAKAKRAHMMLNDPVSRLIPKMAVPTIVAQLVIVVYNLVDAYFVTALGTEASAAISVNSSLEQIMNLIAMLISVGASSYISRLLGVRDNKKASTILSTAFYSGLILSIAVTAVGLLSIGDLVDLLGADANCRQYSIDYATYVLMAAPFLIGSLILSSCLRSEGSATFSMIGISVGAILNCFLDPLFINKLGLGVAGASIATAVSKLVSFVILLYPYVFRKSLLTISVKLVKYTKADVFEVLSISASSVFRLLLQVLSGTIMNRVARQYSTSILAAVGIGKRVMMFPFAIIMGFSQGYLPVAGFNWGAKRYDRVKESLRFSLIAAAIGSAIMGTALFVFARQAVSVFNKSGDVELMIAGSKYMRYECCTLIIHAVVTMVNMFYAGVGRPREAMLLGTSRQGYCLIPLLLILPHFFGVDGITTAQALADLLTLIPGIPLMIRAFKMLSDKAQEQQE